MEPVAEVGGKRVALERCVRPVALILELKALAAERKLDDDGVGLRDCERRHRREYRQIDLPDVYLWRNRSRELPCNGARRRLAAVGPTYGRQWMMDAEADLRVVELALSLSVHLVGQDTGARGSHGPLPLKADGSLVVAAPAGNAEAVDALVDGHLHDLRQNRVPSKIPNRNVDTARDLDVAPANEPEIDAVEHSRQKPR